MFDLNKKTAEATKVAKYAALASKHVFIPLAFETLRAWGEQARVFVVQLGRLITGVTGDVRETDFLRQRLSIAIQRGQGLICNSGTWWNYTADFYPNKILPNVVELSGTAFRLAY